MPSGGDWARQRQGAITTNYVENLIISNNLFTRLDGNSISINRYARNVSINNNEIVWNGDSAITLWGDTIGTTDSTFIENDYLTQMGYDGTTGNQPRGIIVRHNFIHEIGIWEKQSSPYFQAKSCQNKIYRWVQVTVSRAGIR